MTNQKEDHPETSIFRSSRPDSDTGSDGGRREPGFGRYQDSSHEEYEEPERDTDYFSAYSADDEHHDEDEEQDDLFPRRDDTAVSKVSSAGSWSSLPASGRKPAEDDEPEDADEWLDDEDDYDADDEREPTMPLRLIAVAVVAVLLLIVGAYGVLQERASMQDELQELRASLATGVRESDLVDTREALRGLQAAYDSLAAQSSALSQENEQLKEAIATLEAERSGVEAPAPAAEEQVVEAEPEAGAAPVDEAPQAAPAAAAAPPSEPAPATAGQAGNWFVNFGSYTSPETAQGWAAKLRPVQGEVVVVPGAKDDQTYYRVRVIGLNGKNAAELVARQLEAEMQVSRLWVGQE